MIAELARRDAIVRGLFRARENRFAEPGQRPVELRSRVPKQTRKPPKSRIRPLIVRPGTNYECAGDGLCCTDIHGLGPLTRTEVKRLRLISPDLVASPSESGFDEPMLATRRGDGGCLFLGVRRCELHASLGATAKPDGCQRFPLGLAATPDGGRVTTRHRCPCRTLGVRPPLTPERAEGPLSALGRLAADRVVGRRVDLDEEYWLGWEDWLELEAKLFADLQSGIDALVVLDRAPFPRLKKKSWKQHADEMVRDGADHTRFGVAIEWFAYAIKAQNDLRVPETVRSFPWGDDFDRAEQRSPIALDPTAMWNEWVVDEIWSLAWTEVGSFELARRELATRLAIGRDIASRLVAGGTRPDRAVSEALAVIDVVGDSEWWEEIVATMVVGRAKAADRSPALAT
jgi:hypothetical protein